MLIRTTTPRRGRAHRRQVETWCDVLRALDAPPWSRPAPSWPVTRQRRAVARDVAVRVLLYHSEPYASIRAAAGIDPADDSRAPYNEIPSRATWRALLAARRYARAAVALGLTPSRC